MTPFIATGEEFHAFTDLGKATVPIVHAMDKWGADFFTRLGVPTPCDET